MQYPRRESLLSNARKLRKNLTKEERHLWFDFLRYCLPRFRRQEIIGPYIVDFFCYQAKLAVELDGSQHMEPDGIAYDRNRTDYLESLGIRVLRFHNSDIHTNFEGVCQRIFEVLKSQGLHPSVTFGDSSPQGEP